MILFNALKGIGGEPEIIRTSGAFSLIAFVLSVIGFTVWTLATGGKFDVIAYCASFSGGAVAIFGAIAGAVSLKDRNVTAAQATQAQTNAVKAETGPTATDAADQVAGAAVDAADEVKAKAGAP